MHTAVCVLFLLIVFDTSCILALCSPLLLPVSQLLTLLRRQTYVLQVPLMAPHQPAALPWQLLAARRLCYPA